MTKDPVFISISEVEHEFPYVLLETVAHLVPEFGAEVKMGDPDPIFNAMEDALINNILQAHSGYTENFGIGVEVGFYFKPGKQPKSALFKNLPVKIRRQYALLTEQYRSDLAAVFKKHYGDNLLTEEEMEDMQSDFAVTMNDYRDKRVTFVIGLRQTETEPAPESD